MSMMVSIKNLMIVKEIIPKPFNYLGIALITLGIIMILIVVRELKKNNTEIHTFRKPGKLVTNGLFRISRNPIYLGFTISLVGVWVLLGTILPILGCLVFIVVTDNYYIPFEEQNMENIFRDEYKNYKKKVRRWI